MSGNVPRSPATRGYKLCVVACFSGDFASKQMTSARPLSFTSRSLLLTLLKKPPVWYCSRCPRARPRARSPRSGVFPLVNVVQLLLLPLPRPPNFPRPSRSMIFAHLCLGGTSYTLLSWLPTYFKETFPHSKVVFLSVGEMEPRSAALDLSVANLSVLAGLGVQRNTVALCNTSGSGWRLCL